MSERPKPAKNSLIWSSLSILLFPLLWLPAFGWLFNEAALTWNLMKVGLGLVLLCTVVYWVTFLLQRAFVQPLLRAVLGLYTGILYIVRSAELLKDEFFMPAFQVFFWCSLIFTILLIRAWLYYRSQQREYEQLYQEGLLEKYGLLKKQNGNRVWTYKPMPGLGGQTPQERAQAELRRVSWLMLIPASGIVFYLIRTTSGSIAWILLLIDLLLCSITIHAGTNRLAFAFQLLNWEQQTGDVILTGSGE
jgi:hypothetical protein